VYGTLVAPLGWGEEGDRVRPANDPAGGRIEIRSTMLRVSSFLVRL